VDFFDPDHSCGEHRFILLGESTRKDGFADRQSILIETYFLVVTLNLRELTMPIISRFFGIIIRMFYDDHNPPHFHAEYKGENALFDFNGNILKGSLNSRTATKLVREWIDLHVTELEKDWQLAQEGKDITKIKPLN
jgi:hypothetical protein